MRFIGVAVVLAVAVASPADGPRRSSDQPPVAVVTAITPDSLQLLLRQPAHLIVVELPPRRLARLVYPAEDQEWTPTPAGKIAVSLAGSAIAQYANGARLDAQCVIDAAAEWTWIPSAATTTRTTRTNCGQKDYSSGVTYPQGGDDEAYVVVVTVDPNLTLRGLGGLADARSPTTLARIIGNQVTSGRWGPTDWQATVVRLR